MSARAVVGTLLLLSSCHAAYAANTIAAVTNNLGSMVNVTVTTTTANSCNMYSSCINLTPYTYTWRVNDLLNTSMNSDGSAYTLNDFYTAAIALCIVKATVSC